MLWYKSWLETRWRFLIGLVLLSGSAVGTVVTYPQVIRILHTVPQFDLGGEIGQKVRESAQLVSTFRGYIWSQWFLQNMPHLWIIFAGLIGTGGLLSQASGGGTLFTLSLPVSRNRLVGIRAATGLLELLALALIPSLLIPALAPWVGRTYGLGDTLVHGLCLFVVGSMYFSLAFLLSTEFSDVWRPPLIVLCVAVLLSIAEKLVHPMLPTGVSQVMSAESYFRGTGLPWLGLLAAAAVSTSLLFVAARNVARRDF